MSFFDELRDELPDNNRILYLLALTVIGAALLGNLALTIVAVLPNWQLWQAANLQLQQVYAEMERSQSRRDTRSPEDVRAEIIAAEADLRERKAKYLNETEGIDLLYRLYQYAGERGVRIMRLESQPAPGVDDSELDQALYEIRRFRVVVRGAIDDLLAFVGSLAESAALGVVVSDVLVVSEEDAGRLEMNLSMAVVETDEGAELPEAEGDDPQFLFLHAWEGQGWQQVIDGLRDVLAADPEDAVVEAQLHMAYINYGNQLLEDGAPVLALAQFERALILNPGSAEGRLGLAQAEQALPATQRAGDSLEDRLEDAWAEGDWETVIDTLIDLRASESSSAAWDDKLYRAYLNQGRQFMNARELSEAKLSFTKALQVRPGGAEAQQGLLDLSKLSPSDVPDAPVP
jgi:tetratricopeptide (TPR) repeat protein